MAEWATLRVCPNSNPVTTSDFNRKLLCRPPCIEKSIMRTPEHNGNNVKHTNLRQGKKLFSQNMLKQKNKKCGKVLIALSNINMRTSSKT
jgi:hypothetical protein